MSTPQSCVACGRTQEDIPLIRLAYKGTDYWICPQHLPALIHNPHTLVGKLPGAEGMEAADHHD